MGGRERWGTVTTDRSGNDSYTSAKSSSEGPDRAMVGS